MTDLPDGWAWTTLGEVGLTRLFSDGDWVESKDQDPSGPNRLVQLADVGVGLFKDKSSRWMNDQAFERLRCTPLSADDVLIARMPDPLGRACLLPSLPYRSATVVDVAILRPDQTLVDPKWLMWTINTDTVSSQMDAFATGTTRRRISRKNLEKIAIPLPPLAEQHRIVDVLEDHLSRLDIAESTLNTVEQRSRGLDSFCLDDVVLGRSLSLPLTSCPGTLEGKHGRFDYQALPSLPAGWEWKLAESICESVSSGSTPAADLMQQGRGEVPFLKVYNIDPAGRVDFTKNPTFVSSDTHHGQLRRSIARPGDVVTNIVGPPLGKSAIIPDSYPEWNHNQAIVAFRAGNGVEPEWLAACLRSPFVVNLLKSTARATAGQFNIALSTCRELPLPKPPVDVQRALLEELSDRQSVLQHAGATISAARARSAALRRSILRTAFSGDLVDQDPSDEPAELALERFRAESKPVRKRAARSSTAVTTQG